MKKLFLPVLFVFSIWLAGLFFYHYHIINISKIVKICDADAVVVLTGGHARIADAINLLKPNSKQILLISGTGIGVTKKDIMHVFSKNNNAFAERIFIGSYAQNTIDNATEAKAFVLMHNLKSICLVTSDYHMPRSFLLFKDKLPQHVLITPYAINSRANMNNWQYIKLLLQEYNKFLYSFLLKR
jgi:uncharacterized SAM-binding protein YcdF (DUF218 family)